MTAVADEMILKGFFSGADYRKKDIGLSRMMLDRVHRTDVSESTAFCRLAEALAIKSAPLSFEPDI